MKCPKCNEDMENKWNLSGITYTSNPSQHDDVWVCHKCKCKLNQRVFDKTYYVETYDNYENITNF